MIAACTSDPTGSVCTNARDAARWYVGSEYAQSLGMGAGSQAALVKADNLVKNYAIQHTVNTKPVGNRPSASSVTNPIKSNDNVYQQMADILNSDPEQQLNIANYGAYTASGVKQTVESSAELTNETMSCMKLDGCTSAAGWNTALLAANYAGVITAGVTGVRGLGYAMPEIEGSLNGKPQVVGSVPKYDGAGGGVVSPNTIPYEPTGSFISQGEAPVCGPACAAMTIADNTGASVSLEASIGSFQNGIRPTGVSTIELSSVIEKAGIANSVNLSMLPSELNQALSAGNTVILNVKGHFIIVDSLSTVNGVSYYMTRDPYMGPRGVSSTILNNAIATGANAILIGK